MENLNAEQVKRGLECLNNKVDRDCNTCPIFWKARKPPITQNCRHLILDAALALINSQEQRIKELTEENERLNGVLQLYRKYNTAIKAERADTVRKMHAEIKERCIEGGIYPAFVASTIDQIAKEMIGKEDTDGK